MGARRNGFPNEWGGQLRSNTCVSDARSPSWVWCVFALCGIKHEGAHTLLREHHGVLILADTFRLPGESVTVRDGGRVRKSVQQSNRFGKIWLREQKICQYAVAAQRAVWTRERELLL